LGWAEGARAFGPDDAVTEIRNLQLERFTPLERSPPPPGLFGIGELLGHLRELLQPIRSGLGTVLSQGADILWSRGNIPFEIEEIRDFL
jgi:hypothetical protein